jgi:hypothetical protein
VPPVSRTARIASAGLLAAAASTIVASPAFAVQTMSPAVVSVVSAVKGNPDGICSSAVAVARTVTTGSNVMLGCSTAVS